MRGWQFGGSISLVLMLAGCAATDPLTTGPLSVEELIADAEHYHGKTVVVRGYATTGGLTSDSPAYGGVCHPPIQWIAVESAPDEPMRRPYPSGARLLVRGTFYNREYPVDIKRDLVVRLGRDAVYGPLEEARVVQVLDGVCTTALD